MERADVNRWSSVLTTARLRLAPLAAPLAEGWAHYWDRNRAHFALTAPPVPAGPALIEWARASAARAERQWDEDVAYRFVMLACDGGDDTVLGHVSFTEIVRGPLQACNLGYGLDVAHVGQGLMREALKAGISFAFDVKRLHRIAANHLPTNERSARTLRALGFVPEGYARDYLFMGGAWRDHVLTALTNPAMEGQIS
jgi:ribosomal-protein-alanine N-acetyltransferase